MKKKVLATLLTFSMVASLAACGSSGASTAETPSADSQTTETTETTQESTATEGTTDASTTEATNYGGITLTFMNSKPEISDALEEVATTWGDAHGVTFEFYDSSNPSDTLAQKYAAGDGPILAVVDSVNIVDMAEEKMLPLDGEEWISYTTFAKDQNGKVYGWPFTVESQCIVVNKTAVEETLGHEFNKDDYKTTEQFEALMQELRDNGMENPVAMLSEEWSMCGHLFSQQFNFQDGTAQGAFDYIDRIKAGEDPMDDPMFQNQVEIYRILSEYNINKADPLAAVYDLNCAYLADGDAAFMPNGTWVWPDLKELVDDSTEFEIMPYPINNEEINGRVQAAATKWITVDNTIATDDQKAAAKEFLNYLAMDDQGQKDLVEKCGIVSAFDNNPYAPADPVNTSLAVDYMSKGLTVNTSPFGTPSDHRTCMAPYVQKLVTGVGTARELADAMIEYWATAEPTGR